MVDVVKASKEKRFEVTFRLRQGAHCCRRRRLCGKSSAHSQVDSSD